MSALLAALLVSLPLGALALARARQRRRAELLGQLHVVVRDLATILGPGSALDDVAGGAIQLTVEGRPLRVSLRPALEIATEPDPARRLLRLRWLVEQERARQEG